MKKVKSIYLAILTICAILPFKSIAQTDTRLTQYWEVPSFYNPAATGLTDFIRIRGGARLQWLGIDNAPRNFIGVADMPVKIGSKRIGVGVMVNQQTAGLYHTLNLGAQVSYKLRKLGGLWSFGVQGGMYDQSFKGSEVYIPDDDDYHQGQDQGIPTTDIHGTAFDLAAGIRYDHKWFNAAISCTHITSPTITMNMENQEGGSETSGTQKYQFQAKRTFYFIGQGNIPIKNTLFEVIPSVLVRTDLDFTTAEVTARARYRKFLSFGIGYAWNEGISVNIGADIKNFYIGYAYEYPTSAIRSASSGTHELFVGYSLKLDLSDKNKHRHKSVRIL
ncbi:MAG: PorP/SprF family type IX secretion system membrane protein [Bacteroidales bacterium]|nr:PorP/SprF family type IX secretion system membrane protein [Bacteroidales bacterium]